MLRKMVKGGYRRKINSWSFVLTNKEILKICKTENIEDYSSRVQRNYLADVVRSSNSSTAKRILFNSNEGKKRGRNVNLKRSVIEKQNCTEDEFISNAMKRKF